MVEAATIEEVDEAGVSAVLTIESVADAEVAAVTEEVVEAVIVMIIEVAVEEEEEDGPRTERPLIGCLEAAATMMVVIVTMTAVVAKTMTAVLTADADATLLEEEEVAMKVGVEEEVDAILNEEAPVEEPVIAEAGTTTRRATPSSCRLNKEVAVDAVVVTVKAEVEVARSTRELDTMTPSMTKSTMVATMTMVLATTTTAMDTIIRNTTTTLPIVDEAEDGWAEEEEEEEVAVDVGIRMSSLRLMAMHRKATTIKKEMATNIILLMLLLTVLPIILLPWCKHPSVDAAEATVTPTLDGAGLAVDVVVAEAALEVALKLST